MRRTIIFGDIHGCHREWRELMNKVAVTDQDRLISVGDLICKGESSRTALDIAMGLENLQCVLGNHELFMLNCWRDGKLDTLEHEYQRKMIDELGDEVNKYMSFIQTWPLFLDLEECLIVHAGIRPQIRLEEQDPNDLVCLRTLGPDNVPWYERYHEKKLIVHGHWAKKGLVVKENVIGLDTGCVYGRKLSAVILPERKIVSVDAKKIYFAV